MLDLYITAQRRFHLEAQPDEQPASAPTTATAAKILAQHHGVPTRSLDWTRNPLYAAYFAASEVESAQVDGKIAVWALQADMLKAQGYTPNTALRHTHDLSFALDVQTGCSTSVIRKLTLPYSEVGELLRLPWLKGISRAHLMPTINNVVHTLGMRWKWGC